MLKHFRAEPKISCFILTLAISFVSAVSAAEPIPSGDADIISPSARLEKLFDQGFFTEGPAVAPDGMVYFSDITFSGASGMQAGHLWKYDPGTGKSTIFRSPSGMSNGLNFDAQGRMLVAEGADFGGRRIIRTDMKTGKSTIIAGLYEGRKFNAPNDITLDEQGRIYFTDPKYFGHETVEQEVMGVYRIDLDGSIHRIIKDAGKPNGVAISPDQKTFYLVSNDEAILGFSRMEQNPILHNSRNALLAYDLAADGTVKFRKVLVNYARGDGPDGIDVDVAGNIYAAVRNQYRPGISVFSPEGKELAYIPTKDTPTNVSFGRGVASKILYVTAGNSLYRITMMKDGYHLPSK